MSSEPSVFTFETFENIDLYDLAETARNENYTKLAEWVSRYKYRSIRENNRQWEIEKRKEYRHEYRFLLKLIDAYIAATSGQASKIRRGIFELRRMRRRIRLMTQDIFGNLVMSQESKLALVQFLRKRDFGISFRNFVERHFQGEAGAEDISVASKKENRELSAFIEKKLSAKDKHESVKEYIDPDRFIPGYEQKLNDHVFLLDELVEILGTEYDRRIISTKTRFEEYLRPLKRVLEKIDEEVREIDEDLAFLEDDPNIEKSDREKLAGAFTAKKQELLALKKREFDKLGSIKLISENIRQGVEQFRTLIDSLKKKLRYFKKRQFYVEKLARYGADIPKFKSILDDLYATFNREIKSLQKSFLLFDYEFQKTILAAIDDQSVINRIVLSPHGVLDAELAIEAASVPENADLSGYQIMDTIELDLSFLKPYDETGSSASP